MFRKYFKGNLNQKLSKHSSSIFHVHTFLSLPYVMAYPNALFIPVLLDLFDFAYLIISTHDYNPFATFREAYEPNVGQQTRGGGGGGNFGI